MGTCVNCGNEFVKGNCRLNRYSLEKRVIKTETIREVLMEHFDCEVLTPLADSSSPFEDRCVCFGCYNYIERIQRRRLHIRAKLKEIEIIKESFLANSSPKSYLSFKRCETDGASGHGGEERKRKQPTCFHTPPIKSPIIGAIIRPPSEKKTKIEFSEPSDSVDMVENGSVKTKRVRLLKKKVMHYINISRYQVGFKLLITKSPVAKKHFMSFLQYLIRKEMSAFMKTSEYAGKTFTEETSMESFNWGEFFEHIRTGLPLLHTVLESFITRKEMVDNVRIDKDGNIGPLIPGLGLVLAILLRLRRPKKFNLIQSIISVQVYRHIRSQKLLNSWFKLGLCISPGATRTLMKRFKHVEKAPDPKEKSRSNSAGDAAESGHTTISTINSCTEEEVAARLIEEEVMEFAEWSVNADEQLGT